MGNKQAYAKAGSILEQRKYEAEQSAERRKIEAYDSIPGLREEMKFTSSFGQRLVAAMFGGGNSQEAIDKLHTESDEHKARVEKLCIAHCVEPFYWEVKYSCPICEDRGVNHEANRRCECFMKEARKALCDEINADIPLEYSDFCHFDLDLYHGADKARMTEIYNICLDFAITYETREHGLIMQGIPGNGKTHLSIAIAKRVIESGGVAGYDTVPSICREFERRRFEKRNRDNDEYADASVNDYEETLRTADVLILDDLGAEAYTPYTISQLFELLNARINARKPTVISTNLTDRDIEAIYGARIMSRLRTFTPLIFVNVDMRALRGTPVRNSVS